MKIKIKDIPQIFSVINHLSMVNQEPFRTRAMQLLYKLQPDIKFLQGLKKEQVDIIKDQDHEIDLEPLPAPEFYGQEHEKILTLVCKDVKERKSTIQNLLKDK